MTTNTYRAIIEAILDGGEWTTDRKVAADIGCSPSTVSQHRRSWEAQTGIIRGTRNVSLPPDVVDYIWETRGNEGLSWADVAKSVNDTFDITVSADRCARLYRRDGYKEKRASPNVNPDAVVFPLQTRIGVMYGPSIRVPGYSHKKQGKYKNCCDYCDYLAHCQTHPQDVCRCETAQVDEVVE